MSYLGHNLDVIFSTVWENELISELKQTTVLEWSRNPIIRLNSFTKTGLVNSGQDNLGPDFAHL